MLNVDDVSYTNHLGKTFSFGSETGVVLGATELFDYSWDFNAAKSVYSTSRKARKVPVQVIFLGTVPKSRDSFYETVDVDAIEAASGTLTVDGWSLRGLFTASSRTEYRSDEGFMVRDMTFVAESDMWVRSITTSFDASQTRAAIVNEGFIPSPVTIEALGPLADGFGVAIGECNYQVDDLSVPEGSRLVINGLDKTIAVVDSDGNAQNALGHRSGRQVKGSGYYSFEHIAPGYNEVTWHPTCGMYITVHELRSEPRST